MSCEGISGYEVRLYSPHSLHKNLTRHIGANGTFYILEDEDKLAMVGSEDTHVQVWHVKFDAIYSISSILRFLDHPGSSHSQ